MQHPSSFPLPCPLPPLQLIWGFVSPASSYSPYLNAPLYFFALLAFPFPHSGSYIQSLACSRKPMEIQECGVTLCAVTEHDGEISLSLGQQQLFYHMSAALYAFGI